MFRQTSETKTRARRSGRKVASRPVLPASHLARIKDLNLNTVSYLNTAIKAIRDGEERQEWLPRDIIGPDGKTLIVYRSKDSDYLIDGWETWYDGMFGGRFETILSALAWVERAQDIRAGRAKDFGA